MGGFFKKAKSASWVAERINKLPHGPPRDLFAKKINLKELQVHQQKDLPVTFPISFVFTADKKEIREIRQGQRSGFGEEGRESDFVEPEGKKPNLDVPSKTTQTGRFQVEDLQPEPELEGKEGRKPV